jgi:hypothetical protein
MLLARIFFCFSRVTFKATAKGGGRLAASIVGDVWLHALFFGVLAITVAVGVWQLVAGASALTPLLISILWAATAAVPPALLLVYAATGQGVLTHIACKVGMAITAVAPAAAVGLVWAIKDFTPQQFAGGVVDAKTIGLAFRGLGTQVSQGLG